MKTVKTSSLVLGLGILASGLTLTHCSKAPEPVMNGTTTSGKYSGATGDNDTSSADSNAQKSNQASDNVATSVGTANQQTTTQTAQGDSNQQTTTNQQTTQQTNTAQMGTTQTGSSNNNQQTTTANTAMDELKTKCRASDIQVVNEDNDAYKIYSSAIPDPKTTLADIGMNDCLFMYKNASEVHRVEKITIYIGNYGGVAYARPGPNDIHFDASYIKQFAGSNNADGIKQEMLGVMTHEINHLYQNFWADGNKYTPFSEGVCDAIRATRGLYPPGRKQHGGNVYGSYTTTGYFLVYLNEKYPDFIYKFNQAAPKWNDNFWQQTTGKTVDTLWNEYQVSF